MHRQKFVLYIEWFSYFENFKDLQMQFQKSMKLDNQFIIVYFTSLIIFFSNFMMLHHGLESQEGFSS
jgi:hypothetical protein